MESKYDIAKGNPGRVYGRPENVLKDKDLDREQKIAVLESWEAEAIHLQESTAEGFGGGEQSGLDEIEKALAVLKDEV